MKFNTINDNICDLFNNNNICDFINNNICNLITNNDNICDFFLGVVEMIYHMVLQ